MSSSVTAPAQAGQRLSAPARRDSPGRVIVGDYVGQAAAAAVQAVRRAGLRPGLDRSFGCDADLTGLTVAQEPPPGSEIARNGNVTLYVAALGADAEPDGEQGDLEGVATEEATQDASAASDALDALALPRRRRKPRRGAPREQQRLDAAPEPTVKASHANPLDAPVAAEGRTAEQNDERQPQAAQTWAAETAEVPLGARHEPSYETLLAEDVFAGHAGEDAAWGGRHPRDGASRAWQGALSWAQCHPLLAISLCAMLAVWVVVALASALASPRANHTKRAAPSPIRALTSRSGGRHPAPKHTTAQAQRADVGLAAQAPSTQRQRHRATPQPIRPTAQATDVSNTPPQPEAPSVRAAAAEPSRAPTPTPAQSGGGPFSP